MKNTPPSTQQQPETKPKFKKEIAAEMGISLSTLRRWLKKAKVKTERGLQSVGKQAEMREKLG